MTSEQRRSVGQMVRRHQHKRPYPIKSEANMATLYFTFITTKNTNVHIRVYHLNFKENLIYSFIYNYVKIKFLNYIKIISIKLKKCF